MSKEPRKPDPQVSVEDRQDAMAQGAPPPAGTPDKESEIQDQLDAALADSFPASDPVSIATSQHEEDWERDRHKPA